VWCTRGFVCDNGSELTKIGTRLKGQVANPGNLSLRGHLIGCLDVLLFKTVSLEGFAAAMESNIDFSQEDPKATTADICFGICWYLTLYLRKVHPDCIGIGSYIRSGFVYQMADRVMEKNLDKITCLLCFIIFKNEQIIKWLFITLLFSFF